MEHFQDEAPNVAVFLESRFIPYDCELVLRQFSRFLDASQWCVYLYVTSNVYDKYCKLTSMLGNNIKVFIEHNKLSTAREYSDILMSLDFWTRFLKFNYVLIFQLDTMLYRYGIEKFLNANYAYVGAPWPKEYFGNDKRVGNGGLSLRKMEATLACLMHKEIVNIPEKYIKEKYCPEDVFFSLAMYQFGYLMPSPEIASLFSVEMDLANNQSIGSHQLDRFHLDLFKLRLEKSIIPYFCSDGSMFEKFFSNSSTGYNFFTKFESIIDNKPWVGFFESIIDADLSKFKNCKGLIIFQNCTNISPLVEFINISNPNSPQECIEKVLNSFTTKTLLGFE